jgi:hypothetical protein
LELVPSGVSLPFEVTYSNPGLPVALSVFDITGGQQTLVSGPTAMVNVVDNTYVGYWTALAGHSYLIFKAVYTDTTFDQIDITYSQGTETIQASGVDTSILVPQIGLTSPNFVPVPQMLETLGNWLYPITFTVVSKAVIGFQNVETPTVYSFKGTWQPFTTQQLLIKPLGQRAWKWFMVHAATNIPLNPDDVISYKGTQYRVMEKFDYTEYGYFQFDLIIDYVGSGP